MKVEEILKIKGYEVATIPVDGVVADALQEMVKRNIGSLVVVSDAGQIEGIVTERDVMRAAHHTQANCKGLSVREVMTPKEKLVVGGRQDDIEAMMGTISTKRIRHIPILNDEGKLAGLISIGDVIKALLKDREYQIRYLQDYIQNIYPV